MRMRSADREPVCILRETTNRKHRNPRIRPLCRIWILTLPRRRQRRSDPPEGIRIPGYPSITIPADTKDVTVNLMNPEGNPCYFTFTLVLKDTDETIYQSKMVEPGKAITQITLSKELSAGEYPAILKISTAAMDDGRAMNGANVETVLKVQ